MEHGFGKTAPVPETISLYAWVGEDELGSGRIGIKQGLTPAGMIPLVAIDYHMDRVMKMAPAMEVQAGLYGKKIRLCRFQLVEVVTETKAGA